MIEAEIGDFDVVWQAGRVTVRPGVGESGVIARTRIAAECLKLQAEIERRLAVPAYDREAFATDRPFRVPPGSVDHARLVLEGLGAEIGIEIDDEDDEDVEALMAEMDAEDADLFRAAR